MHRNQVHLDISFDNQRHLPFSNDTYLQNMLPRELEKDY